jgi:hypothetical protein
MTSPTSTTDPTVLRSRTSYVFQTHVATGVVLTLGRNNSSDQNKHTQHTTENLLSLLPELHRSDRWCVPVRPADSAGQTGGDRSRTETFQEASMTLLGYGTKATSETQTEENKNLHTP